MPLTAMQKSQIRRHLKYGIVGFSSASAGGGGGTLGTNSSYLATSSFAKLEIILDSLQPCDEATLIGKAFGSVTLRGFPPAAGDSITLNFSNLTDATQPLLAAYSKTITCGADQAGSFDKFALLVALAVSQDVTLGAAGFMALTPYGPGSNVINVESEIGVTNKVAFQLSATTSGQFVGAIENDGSDLPEPRVQLGKNLGIPIVTNGYLPLLNFLYAAIGTATTRQGTLQADVFKARQDEVTARADLYDRYRRDMADFLDLDLNPDAKGGRGAYGRIRL